MPTYSFTSNTNTGIYRIGADNLGIACNGAKVLDISTTGLALTSLFSNSGQPCHIRQRSATQSVSNTTDTTLTNWGTTELDQGNITYASGVFTVPSTGVYLIHYIIDIADNTTGTRNSNFYINNNSANKRARTNIGAAASGGQGITVSAGDICYLTANDNIRLIVWQSSGGSLNYTSDGSARICIARLF